MKKFITLILFLVGPFVMIASAAQDKNAGKTAYDFSFRKPNGDPLPLSDYKGKVLLIVNTASNCNFTKQYESLEKLYKKYRDRGFAIIAIPSNDFGHQEPGSDDQIQEFCKVNYGITFDAAAKETISGKEAHPFYLWARNELGFGSAPKWNFHKYLIDRNGNIVDYFYTITSPKSNRLVKKIEQLLEETEK